jgi:hypothetical protein
VGLRKQATMSFESPVLSQRWETFLIVIFTSGFVKHLYSVADDKDGNRCHKISPAHASGNYA